MQGPRHVYQPWRNHSQCEGCAIAMAAPPTWAHWPHVRAHSLKACLWEDQEAAVRCQATIAQASVFLPRVLPSHLGASFVLLISAEAQRLNLPAREALVEALNRRPLAVSISGVLSLLGP